MWQYLYLVLLALPAVHVQTAPAPKADEQVVLRKELTPGNTLVVSLGPTFRTGELRDIGIGSITATPGTVVTVRVELHTPAARVPLASRLDWEPDDQPEERGIHVLDVCWRPGRVVLAIAVGSRLVMWQVGMLGRHETRWCIVRGADWSAAALLRRINPTLLEVRLQIDKSDRVSATVTDRSMGGGPLNSLLEQGAQGEWSFRSTRQWREGERK